MHQLKGLYISLILIMFINLMNFNLSEGEYSATA